MSSQAPASFIDVSAPNFPASSYIDFERSVTTSSPTSSIPSPSALPKNPVE
jgi:hypothetical protein